MPNTNTSVIPLAEYLTMCIDEQCKVKTLHPENREDGSRHLLKFGNKYFVFSSNQSQNCTFVNL